jgi:hypothetical protein
MSIKRISRALEELKVKYLEHFFTRDHMLLSHPLVCIFDCKCYSTVEEDAEWIVEDYKKSLSLIQQWMDQIPHWNVIFLLHEGNLFDADYKRTLDYHKVPL